MHLKSTTSLKISEFAQNRILEIQQKEFKANSIQNLEHGHTSQVFQGEGPDCPLLCVVPTARNTQTSRMQCYWKPSLYVQYMSPAGSNRMPVHTGGTLPYSSSPECKSFIHNWFLTFWKVMDPQVSHMSILACIFRKTPRDINTLHLILGNSWIPWCWSMDARLRIHGPGLDRERSSPFWCYSTQNRAASS